MTFLLWLADKLLEILGRKTKLKVLVHEAFFDNNREPYYFIKVVNISPQNDFTITHIWIKDNINEKEILNPLRPLPHTLEKSKVFETWFPKAKVEDKVNIFQNVRVVLSDGNTYKSEKNLYVRPKGFVA